MSEAIASQGSKLYVAFTAGSPADFTPIPEVRSIGGPSETSDEIEVTNLDSVGGRREFIAGFSDSDDCPVEMNYIPGNAVQAQFLALYDSKEKRMAKIEYPDESTVIFEMFLKGRSRPLNVGEAIVITATMRITGATDFSDAEALLAADAPAGLAPRAKA